MQDIILMMKNKRFFNFKTADPIFLAFPFD